MRKAQADHWPPASGITFHYLKALLSVVCKILSAAGTRALTIAARSKRRPIRTPVQLHLNEIKSNPLVDDLKVTNLELHCCFCHTGATDLHLIVSGRQAAKFHFTQIYKYVTSQSLNVLLHAVIKSSGGLLIPYGKEQHSAVNVKEWLLRQKPSPYQLPEESGADKAKPWEL